MSKIKLYRYINGPKKEVHMYEAQAQEWISKGILEEVKADKEVKPKEETEAKTEEVKTKKKKKNKKDKNK